MAAIPVTIRGTLKDIDSGNEEEVELQGELTLTGLTVGGGPIIPEAGTPPGEPQFPIVLPPGTPPFYPEAPGGYPPMIGGGPIDPPPNIPEKPPAFIPIWLPDYGWIVVPAFPVPTPSKRSR